MNIALNLNSGGLMFSGRKCTLICISTPSDNEGGGGRRGQIAVYMKFFRVFLLCIEEQI